MAALLQYGLSLSLFPLPKFGEIGLKIFVGNMSFDTSEDGLRAAFAAHGNVEDVAVITDRDTGRPRGFAFITMPDEAGRAAIEALNGSDLDGRALNVNEARPKTDRAGGGGGGGGRGGGGGGGGGRGNW
jgi:cold-inducible RNA-binding protein